MRTKELLTPISTPVFACPKSSGNAEETIISCGSFCIMTMQAPKPLQGLSNFLPKESIEIMHHPPYNPDLVSCDLYRFSNMKQ